MQKTSVYVFGAGASAAKPISAPVMGAFLMRGFELLHSVALQEAQGQADKLFPLASFWSVAEMLDRLFGCSLVREINEHVKHGVEYAKRNDCVLIGDGWPIREIPAGTTIEELLAFTEMDEEGGEWRKYQKSLQDFVFVTLERALTPKRGGSMTVTPQGIIRTPLYCYDHFVTKRIDRTHRNVFLSFNYDDFLDKALWSADPPVPADYGLSFTHVDQWPQYDEMLRGVAYKKEADLLKLHGSINWARCRRCDGLHLFSFRHYLAMFKEPCRRCKNGDALLTPVLVPPTLRKNIGSYGIDGIWERAEAALADADAITIIGYSFPDADTEAKWLFKQAIAKGGKKPDLLIVDPSARVRETITAFFGKTVINVKCLPDFETYVGD
jgi:hypothetical protein